MAASTMKSGVRKSGWPMPRLMMSRPCAASALARASTAKAFSSPMRSNAAMVFSMGFGVASRNDGGESSSGGVFAGQMNVGHLHDLEDDGDRPADQEEPVERGGR